MTSTALITKDFNGLPVVFREDGYINMTKAAQHYGKRLQHFTESPDTREYVEALEAITGKQCLLSKRGGAKGNSGTWCHPKLAVFFARWLDVRFAVWCDLAIDNILRGDLVVDVAVPTAQAHQEGRCAIFSGADRQGAPAIFRTAPRAAKRA